VLTKNNNLQLNMFMTIKVKKM